MSSEIRRPAPYSSSRIARSRSPVGVAGSGASRRRRVSSTVSGCGSWRGSLGWATPVAGSRLVTPVPQQEPVERPHRREHARDARRPVRTFVVAVGRRRDGRHVGADRRLVDLARVGDPSVFEEAHVAPEITPVGREGVRGEPALDREVIQVTPRLDRQRLGHLDRSLRSPGARHEGTERDGLEAVRVRDPGVRDRARPRRSRRARGRGRPRPPPPARPPRCRARTAA